MLMVLVSKYPLWGGHTPPDRTTPIGFLPTCYLASSLLSAFHIPTTSLTFSFISIFSATSSFFYYLSCVILLFLFGIAFAPCKPRTTHITHDPAEFTPIGIGCAECNDPATPLELPPNPTLPHLNLPPLLELPLA